MGPLGQPNQCVGHEEVSVHASCCHDPGLGCTARQHGVPGPAQTVKRPRRAGWAPCVCPVQFFYANVCVTATPSCIRRVVCWVDAISSFGDCVDSMGVCVCRWLGQFLLLSRLVRFAVCTHCSLLRRICSNTAAHTHSVSIHVTVCGAEGQHSTPPGQTTVRSCSVRLLLRDRDILERKPWGVHS